MRSRHNSSETSPHSASKTAVIAGHCVVSFHRAYPRLADPRLAYPRLAYLRLAYPRLADPRLAYLRLARTPSLSPRSHLACSARICFSSSGVYVFTSRFLSGSENKPARCAFAHQSSLNGIRSTRYAAGSSQPTGSIVAAVLAVLNVSRTSSVGILPSASSRYVTLKPISSGSPSYRTGTASLAPPVSGVDVDTLTLASDPNASTTRGRSLLATTRMRRRAAVSSARSTVATLSFA